MKYSFLFSLVAVLLLSGCQKAAEKLQNDLMPVARGEVGEVILVIDSAHWQGAIGDELKDIYRSPMRGLPQDEPLFDVHKVNPLKLNSVLKSATNMIFVMTLDGGSAQSRAMRDYFTDNSLKMIQRDSSLFMTIRRDEFAKGQIVLYLFSQSEELLLEKMQENKDRLREIFKAAARERMRERVLSQTEMQIINALTEDHGYEIQVPYGWDLARDLPNFTWLRFLEAASEKNVFIYSEPYRDQDIFNNIGTFRDKITETYLRDSQKPQIYINRQEIIPVFTERVNFNGHFAVEARGLWKISDSSGGGPFVSYTIVDEENQMVYYVEGYVYAPGTDKKNLIREVEAIITTFRTPSDLAEKASG